jgi:parvulin-like peptidyl-prolyl isomerase
MSRKRAKGVITRKHMARVQRERRQRAWILAGTLVATLLVIGLLSFGIIDMYLLQPHRPVATVNGEKISTATFQGRVRLQYADLYGQLQSAQQMLLLFGDNADMQATINQQIQQLQAQMQNAFYMGQTAIQDLIDEVLIRQEAVRRGIVVTAADIDKEIASAFGFSLAGTATPAPTATQDLSATQTPTLGEGEEATSTATAGPTSTPRPTPTPYTEEAYQADLAGYLEYLAGLQVKEKDFRLRYEGILYRRALEEQIQAEMPHEDTMVFVKHMQLSTEEEALDAKTRLEQGEEWDALVEELSTDALSQAAGGGLGWLTKVDMATRYGIGFRELALDTPLNEVAGPVQTLSGWDLLVVTKREVRTLQDSDYQAAVDYAFSQWLDDQHVNSEITVVDDWLSLVPGIPQ